MRIALAVDDGCADRIATLLQTAGHAVHRFGSARALIKARRRDSFDLVICEWSVTGVDLDTLAAPHDHDLGPPVILMTAEPDADVAAALNAGADDVLVRPVGDAMVMARIEAVLRRGSGRRGRSPVEVYGDYRLDTAAGSISRSGVALPATTKEFLLALTLFRNMGHCLSRDHLMETVWCQQPGVSRTLDAHVSIIRRSLGLVPQNGLRLEAIYGFGYRLAQAG
jgi:DNA-binding response OmpR family regulator